MGSNRLKLLNKIANYIREKKRVEVSILALKFGYSYSYFKYTILKELMCLYGDFNIVRENDKDYIVVRE